MSRPPHSLPLNAVFGPTYQGEGPHTGRRCHFIRLGHCNLACHWCVVPGMKILRPDFTWTPVEELRVGDTVLGRTSPQQGKHGALAEATVTNTVRRSAPLTRVNGNLTCSEDTRVWTSRNKSVRSGWREFTRSKGLNCTFLTEPIKHNQKDYERGYVAGMIDGDGSFWTLDVKGRNNTHRRFRLALNEQNLLDRTRDYAERAGFTLRPGNHSHTGFNGKGNMPCLWLTQSQEADRFEQWVEEDVNSDSWAWGYLGGIFDAEGSISQTSIIRISQNPEASKDGWRVYERMASAAERLNLRFAREPKGIRLGAAGGEIWRFMVGAAPAKANALAKTIGRAPNNARTVLEVEDAGHGDVIALTTSTGNYIAEGWLVHNCDTPDTWDTTRYNIDTENPWTPVETILDRLHTQTPGSLVVLSGGEPLMHQQRPALHTLLERLTDQGTSVHVETNGTITPNEHMTALVEHFTVSPKLANNNADPQTRRIRPRALATFNHLAARGRACFKFVAANPHDLDEIDQLTRTHDLDPAHVWVMPEGTTATDVLTTHRTLAPHLQERDYNTSTRLHTLLWNNEKDR